MGKLAKGKAPISCVITVEAKEYIRQISEQNKWSMSQTAGELLEEIIALKKANLTKKSA